MASPSVEEGLFGFRKWSSPGGGKPGATWPDPEIGNPMTTQYGLIDPTDQQLSRASEFLAQVGATSFWFLPNPKAIVLRFEDRETFAEMSDTYDSFPTQKELTAEFFCRVMNTVVEDVYLSALYLTEERTGGRA